MLVLASELPAPAGRMTSLSAAGRGRLDSAGIRRLRSPGWDPGPLRLCPSPARATRRVIRLPLRTVSPQPCRLPLRVRLLQKPELARAVASRIGLIAYTAFDPPALTSSASGGAMAQQLDLHVNRPTASLELHPARALLEALRVLRGPPARRPGAPQHHGRLHGRHCRFRFDGRSTLPALQDTRAHRARAAERAGASVPIGLSASWRPVEPTGAL